MSIIAKNDIIAKTISIEGTIEGLNEEFIRLDRSYGTYFEFEQLLRIIFDAEGSWDKFPKGVKSGSNGYGVALRMPDSRLAIGIKKWHGVSSF